MEGLLKSADRPEDVPTVLPLFEGTRQDSTQTGSITGLTAENFTPLHLIYGMMDGMAHELHQMYQAYRAAGGTAKKGSRTFVRDPICSMLCAYFQRLIPSR